MRRGLLIAGALGSLLVVLEVWLLGRMTRDLKAAHERAGHADQA